MKRICLWLPLLAGCSGESPEPAPKAPSALPAKAEPGPVPEQEAKLPPIGAEVKGRVRKLSAFQDRLRASIDPRALNWDTERMALEIESQLPAALLAWWERGERAPLEALFSGAGAGEPRPLVEHWTMPQGEPQRVEALWSVYAGGLGERQPGGLFEMLSEWKAGFGGQALESIMAEVSRCEDLGEPGFELELYLRTHTRQGAAGWQHNLRLLGRVARGQKVQWERLQTRRSEWIAASAPPFEERTREVFGGLPCFAEELERGNGDYHLRQDRLTNQPYLGMHGIAIGDPDGDGREDVYVAQPGGQANRLLLRTAEGTLRDASAEWGVDLLDNAGPAFFADLDGDGDQDLAVTNGSNIFLRINQERRALKGGYVLRGPDEAEITSMSAADFDNDGDLDIYACRYASGGMAGSAPVPYHNANNGARNLYWRNDGAKGFVEAAAEVGLDRHAERYTLALYIEDFDANGWMDLYAVNDFGRNCLYLNEQGRFRDVAPERGVLDQAAGMGADMDDVDGDGLLDLYVTNMHTPAGLRVAGAPRFLPEHPELKPDYLYHARGNTLLLARPDGRFEDRTQEAGVAEAGWAWGSRFIDFGNDMWPDIFVPNGFASNPRQDDLDSFFWREVIARTNFTGMPAEEYAAAWDAIRHFTMFENWSWNGWERKYAYLNLGKGRYADVSALARLDFLDDMRCAATLDWDDDGRMDLLLRNRTGPRLRLLINEQSSTHRFVSFELASDGANREAIGAQLYARVGDRTLRRSVQIAQGFMTASSRRVHFPLANNVRIEELRVRWPDGSEQRFEAVPGNEHYRLRQGGKLEVRPRVEAAALRRQPAQASPPVTMAPASRIVLVDKLPMSPIALPRAGGNPRRISEWAGSALILSFGAHSDERALAGMQAIEGRAAERARYGIQHVPIFLNEGADQAQVLRALEGSPLLAQAGFATARLRQLLEVLLIEVLGPFEALPQPLHLILDKGGNLVAIHAAPSDYSLVLRDAATASYLAPEDRGTEALLGGSWARQPARDLKQVAEVLKHLGIPELAQYYLREDARRTNRR